jgi:hypothetical protein
MLTLATKDYDLLLKVRDMLIQVNEGLPADPETVEAFLVYAKELEKRREKDIARQREALKKWRESPTGKEKYAVANRRHQQTFRERHKQEREEN